MNVVIKVFLIPIAAYILFKISNIQIKKVLKTVGVFFSKIVI